MSSAVPIDIYQNRGGFGDQPQRFRRESVAHSQGMGGISWGGMSVGSWLRDEVLYSNMNNVFQSQNPAVNMQGLAPSMAMGSGHSLHRNSMAMAMNMNQMNNQMNNQNPMVNGLNHAPNTGLMVNGVQGPTVASGSMMGMSPGMSSSYLPNLEADFCRDYSCCGQNLPTLHDLLRHYEEAHITPSPPVEPPMMRRIQSLEAVSTNDVFLSPESSNHATPMIVDEDDDMCIDDPARHLYVIERGEHKPFKCPVIGCDKTYKNQNGLKYHRLHGHQNQTLHLNEDGTYSIIDPLSNAPYPDGMGMEKDKPYRCEVCGKRYKNLNGLKYHRGHSTH